MIDTISKSLVILQLNCDWLLITPIFIHKSHNLVVPNRILLDDHEENKTERTKYREKYLKIYVVQVIELHVVHLKSEFFCDLRPFRSNVLFHVE